MEEGASRNDAQMQHGIESLMYRQALTVDSLVQERIVKRSCEFEMSPGLHLSASLVVEL
jgi:hypothetical protein